MCRHVALLAAALTIFVLPVMLTAGGTAGASSSAVNYSLPSVTATPSSPCDVQPCQVFFYTYTGSGSTTTTGGPASGTFTLGFTPTKYKTGSSCAFATGTGTLSVTWADSTTTNATFAFKAHDAHSWDIKGQVTSGTNPAYPPTPATPVGGLVGLPPNPCDGANVLATITFYPPTPV